MQHAKFTHLDGRQAAEEKHFAHDPTAHIHFLTEQGPAFSVDNNAGFSLPSKCVNFACCISAY